jgi:hypothetical protein
MGTTPSSLTVTSQQIETIDGMLVATVEDFAPDSNLPSFGICMTLTAEAEGVSTPCSPALSSPWTPGSTVKTINGMAVLTASSTLACDIGGAITITDPGNTVEQAD